MVYFKSDAFPGLPEPYDFDGTVYNRTGPLPYYMVSVFHQLHCLVSHIDQAQSQLSLPSIHSLIRDVASSLNLPRRLGYSTSAADSQISSTLRIALIT
jgi:hypothetical protein